MHGSLIMRYSIKVAILETLSLYCLILYLTEYKSTLSFNSLKIGPKNRPRLIHGSKTEIKKSSRQIFCVNTT